MENKLLKQQELYLMKSLFIFISGLFVFNTFGNFDTEANDLIHQFENETITSQVLVDSLANLLYDTPEYQQISREIEMNQKARKEYLQNKRRNSPELDRILSSKKNDDYYKELYDLLIDDKDFLEIDYNCWILEKEKDAILLNNPNFLEYALFKKKADLLIEIDELKRAYRDRPQAEITGSPIYRVLIKEIMDNSPMQPAKGVQALRVLVEFQAQKELSEIDRQILELEIDYEKALNDYERQNPQQSYSEYISFMRFINKFYFPIPGEYFDIEEKLGKLTEKRDNLLEEMEKNPKYPAAQELNNYLSAISKSIEE